MKLEDLQRFYRIADWKIADWRIGRLEEVTKMSFMQKAKKLRCCHAFTKRVVFLRNPFPPYSSISISKKQKITHKKTTNLSTDGFQY
ncbi:MAG: hypothetical protein FGM14_08470 [Flavobacteriales bacterium]|nr:hypothetical protein [Flavobacteriales bacterium]